MNSPQYIPSFYFYKFAQGVSEPYTALQAYRGGAIDQNGNILKAESSIDPLEYLIIKLKKIFDELPPGLTKAKLNNYMSTMQLFGEEVKQIGITDSEYIGLVESYIALHIDPSVSYMELCEDMAAGGMGTPGTSTGYNIGSVSGYDPAMGTTKRTTPILKGLDNCEMFDVCPEEMGHFKSAKAWKHIPDTETKNYLQRYQRRNPKAHMAVRSVDPDTGESDLYWINFKPLSFMEEYGLGELDILNEESAVADYTDKTTDKDKNVAVLTNTQESNYDIPEHLHSKVADFISTSLNMKYRTKENKDAGRIIDRKDSHGAELHARMLLFANGLEDISKIPDTAKRHETFSNFINAVHGGRHKNPSVSDQRSKEKHPDAWAYHPEHGIIGAEIKTDRYEGSFPTKLSNTASSEQIEQEKQSNISNIQSQWKNGVVVQRKASGKFFKVSPENITGLWAEHPARVKSRKRGNSVKQENKETAGNVLKIKSFRSLTSKREDPLKISNQTIELLKQHTNSEHHDLLSGILGVHV
jgi:hypothetical protein